MTKTETRLYAGLTPIGALSLVVSRRRNLSRLSQWRKGVRER